MFTSFVKIIASNPPSIAIALGGIGLLAEVSGAGWLLFAGVIMQFGWLAVLFIR